MAFYKCPKAKKETSWAKASASTIADMLTKHYAGEINIYDYWDVGDERVVSLSAQTGITAQDITLVLINKGGRTLADGVTECAFVVNQKNCLIDKHRMYGSNTNMGGWKASEMRTFLNSNYKAALPSDLVGIFKQFNNSSDTGGGNHNSQQITKDYFSLLSMYELYTYTAPNITYFPYFDNRTRIKTNGTSVVNDYWLRDTHSSGTDYYTQYKDGRNIGLGTAMSPLYVSPIGCI